MPSPPTEFPCADSPLRFHPAHPTHLATNTDCQLFKSMFAAGFASPTMTTLMAISNYTSTLLLIPTTSSWSELMDSIVGAVICEGDLLIEDPSWKKPNGR